LRKARVRVYRDLGRKRDGREHAPQDAYKKSKIGKEHGGY